MAQERRPEGKNYNFIFPLGSMKINNGNIGKDGNKFTTDHSSPNIKIYDRPTVSNEDVLTNYYYYVYCRSK